MKNRNKARAELEVKHGYDCYSEDTEFLTNFGWKKYDDIKSTMMLATVKHDNFRIEYQPYIDRFEGLYSGIMYNFLGDHMDILVTPNHRMLFRPVEKSTGKEGDFILEEAAILPNNFDFLRAITPPKKLYKNPVELSKIPLKSTQYLSLMGWYLSDGCLSLRGEKIKDIRISQKKGGRLCRHITRFYNQVKDHISCNLHCYKRKPNRYNPHEIEEMVLVVSDKLIQEQLYEDCSFLKEKRIPRWAFGLSKRLMDVLLNALCLSDGTIRNTSLKSWVYHSTLKDLADDVQELAIACGYETSLYGPYEQEKMGTTINMYQVHINKSTSQFDRLERSKNVKRVPVMDIRIVCFSVLNRTLITRRNGHVAFQGNSKHAAHLVRLIRMCNETLETGKINVDRTNIDAEELIAIRNGAWEYERLEEYAKKMDERAGELYKTSTLKRSPDIKKIKLIIETVCEDYIREHR